MTTYISHKYHTIDRWFGRCGTPGCKYRKITDTYHIDGTAITGYDGRNIDTMRAIGCWCDTHNKPLLWEKLKGRYSDKKECNGVCMGAIGPSCDCSCGGENHGKNHI